MDPIEIALRQKGTEAVKTALRGVVEAIEELDQASARSAESSSRARISALRREISERKRLASIDDGGGTGKRGSGGKRNGGTREAFARATGSGASGGGTRSAVERATKGPTMGDYAGLASSGAGSIMGTIGKFGAVGGAIALFKAGIDLATSALEQFGGFLISDVIKPAFALDTFAVQLENATFGALKSTEVTSKGREMQLRYNFDAQTAAASLGELADKTGNAKLSFDAIDGIAAISKGYGVNMQELSGMAGALYKQDKSLTATDLTALLRTQLKQGADGSITLKEISGLGGAYTQNMAKMAGNADVKAASIGAAMQTGGITGKADVSIGNINSFISEIGKVAKKQGIEGITNEQGQITDLGEALRGVLVKSGGNIQKLETMGLSKEAGALPVQFMSTMQEGLKLFNGDIKKAAEYATADFEKMRRATLSETDVKQAAARVMATSGEKLETAMNQIKIKLLAIMPSVERLVSTLADNAPAIGDALVFMTEALMEAAQVIKEVSQLIADTFGIVLGPAKKTLEGNMEKSSKTVYDPATNSFKTIDQNEINKRKKGDVFDPLNYTGKGLQLKGVPGIEKTSPETPGPAPVLAPLLPGAGSTAPVVVAPSVTSTTTQPASGDKPVLMVDKMNTQLDALAPKLGKLGKAFDMLAQTGINTSRTTPLSQR